MICKNIFWKFIQYTIHGDKANVKTISFEQNKRYKKCTQFLLRAPTHHSFTFNLRFLYEMKRKVHLSERVSGVFHFRFLLVFMKVCIFVQQKAWTLWLENVIIPIKTKIIENSHTVLLSDLWFLSCNKKFENTVITAWVGALQKLTWRWTFST